MVKISVHTRSGGLEATRCTWYTGISWVRLEVCSTSARREFWLFSPDIF